MGATEHIDLMTLLAFKQGTRQIERLSPAIGWGRKKTTNTLLNGTLSVKDECVQCTHVSVD